MAHTIHREIDMSKTNGNGTELIENVDYFEMKDGIWLTIEGVSKKYGIANTTVSWKGNQFNIPKKKIAGSICYKDSNEFEYKKPNAESAKHLVKNVTYSELVHRVTDYTKSTDNLVNKVEDMIICINGLIQQSNMTNKMVTDILEYLTNVKKGE